jgi:hypothetical protein
LPFKAESSSEGLWPLPRITNGKLANGEDRRHHLLNWREQANARFQSPPQSSKRALAIKHSSKTPPAANRVSTAAGCTLAGSSPWRFGGQINFVVERSEINPRF